MAQLVRHALLATITVFLGIIATAIACSHGACKLHERCYSNEDCGPGLYCFSCGGSKHSKCVRSDITDPFKIVNNSLPFNRYSFLTTHNSFAIDGEPSRTDVPRLTLSNQEDSVTEQLNNGVRALMLDTYDFRGDVWLCHSINSKCFSYTAYKPAIDTFKEIETFLSANPSEIVTLILEDYVKAPNGLTRVFQDSGLVKYWCPVSEMPRNGGDWPRVQDMINRNFRLVVFTSVKSKQETEGIAYQWNYMVENQYGSEGMQGVCTNRVESASLDDKTKSLVLVNHFQTVPSTSCRGKSADLIDDIQTCYTAAGNRWTNFVAVDYYKISDGGGAFQAVDRMNGELLCGCNDVNACAPGANIRCR